MGAASGTEQHQARVVAEIARVSGWQEVYAAAEPELGHATL